MIIRDFRPSITEIAPIIEAAVASGKKVKLNVTGSSMCPMLLSSNDTVTLEKAGTIKKYDVLLFKRKTGKYVLHRVIKIKDGVLTIAGDNETKKEYPVYPDEVVAKVCIYQRKGVSHSTSGKRFWLYSRLWLLIFPFRRIITKILYNCPDLPEDDEN